MIARLGNVIYWSCAGLALLLLLWLGGASLIAFASGNPMTELGVAVALVGGCAAAIWLFGRACRYVLAGR